MIFSDNFPMPCPQVGEPGEDRTPDHLIKSQKATTQTIASSLSDGGESRRIEAEEGGIFPRKFPMCHSCGSPLPYLYARTPSGDRCVPCAQAELLAHLKVKPFELTPVPLSGYSEAKLVRLLEVACG